MLTVTDAGLPIFPLLVPGAMLMGDGMVMVALLGDAVHAGAWPPVAWAILTGADGVLPAVFLTTHARQVTGNSRPAVNSSADIRLVRCKVA
jgi:hypothetical protein